MVLHRHVLALDVAGFEAVGLRSSKHGASKKGARTGRPSLPLPRTSAQPHHSITSSARASSVGGTSRPSAFAVLEVDHDFMLDWPQLVDRPVSRRGVAYTGDYCFGGTRVDCQDTNCTPWPRLAHTLWNRACSERSPPLKVRSNSTKPVIMARQP